MGRSGIKMRRATEKQRAVNMREYERVRKNGREKTEFSGIGRKLVRTMPDAN
jgi:hypothetical protein